MSNVRFLYTMKFDAATISSSSEVAGLPDGNVVQEFVGKKWRSTGDAAEWIKFDLGAASKITMVVIFGHNLTSGATVTLEAHGTDVWTTPDYSHVLASTGSATVPIVEFLDQTYRWWRITIADGSNPDGYIEVGRICAGEFYEPGVNVLETVQKSLVDPSIIEESDGKQGYAIEKTKYRVYAVQFGDISAAQQAELETMFRAVGKTRPLVFALDPDSYPENDTIYCKIKSDLNRAMKALAYGDVPMSFEEKI